MLNTLADLLPQVSIRLRNCPANMQLLALRQGWREWCTDSMAFRDTISLTVVAGQTTYRLLPRWDAEVRAVSEWGVRMRTGDDVANRRPGRAMYATQYDLMLYSDPLGDIYNIVQPDKPTTDVADSGFSSLILKDAAPGDAVKIDVDVILVPFLSPDDDSLPLSLVNYAGGGIAAGALAWLAAQAGKPWASAGLYAVEAEKFSQSTARALIDAERGGRNEPVIQRPPEFF